MGDERLEVAGPELARWIVLAALFAAGIGLFFRFAAATPAVLPPAAMEDAP